MEKEDIRSMLSSLLKVKATKVVNINYSNDAVFKNKGNGNQDFSSAGVLSGNNNHSNNRNNDDSNRRQNQPVTSYQYQAPQPSPLQHPIIPNIDTKNQNVRPYQAPGPLAQHPNQRSLPGINKNAYHMENKAVRPYQAPYPMPPRPAAANWDHMRNQPIRPPQHIPNPISEEDEDSEYEDDSEDDEDSEDGNLDFEYTETEDDSEEDEESYKKSKKHVHVGLEQVNGRNVITIIGGIKMKKFDYNDILEDLKERCRCNGRIVMDPDFGQVIQLVGDQRRHVRVYLVKEGIVKKNKHVKIHGF